MERTFKAPAHETGRGWPSASTNSPAGPPPGPSPLQLVQGGRGESISKSARRKSSDLPVLLWTDISSCQTWRGRPWLALSFSYSSGEYFSSRTLQVAALRETMRAVPWSWIP